MDIRSNIAKTIKQYMEERRITVEELSAEFGIPRSSVQNYVKAQVNMRSDTIELLARSMEIDPAALVSGAANSREWKLSYAMLAAAKALSGLPEEGRKEVGEKLVELVELFSRYGVGVDTDELP